MEQDDRYNVDELFQYITDNISFQSTLQTIRVCRTNGLIATFLRRWIQHFIDVGTGVTVKCSATVCSKIYETLFLLIGTFVGAIYNATLNQISEFLEDISSSSWIIWDKEYKAHMRIYGNMFSWRWKRVEAANVLKQLGESAIEYFGSKNPTSQLRQEACKHFNHNLWSNEN